MGEFEKMTRIEELLPLLQGEFICLVNGEEKAFRCKGDFEKSELYQNHTVTSLSVKDGKLVLALTPWQIPVADTNTAWAKEYKEKNGTDLSFF